MTTKEDIDSTVSDLSNALQKTRDLVVQRKLYQPLDPKSVLAVLLTI